MPKDLDQMSVAELQTKHKSLTSILAVILGLWVVYVLALVIFWLTGRWTQTQTLGLVPVLALLAAALPAWTARKQVRARLQTVGQSGPKA